MLPPLKGSIWLSNYLSEAEESLDHNVPLQFVDTYNA